MKPRRADDATRITLVALSRLIEWRRVLTVVNPDTLVRWHRKGFQLFWRWRSRPRGRPRVAADLRRLIDDMATANRTWVEKKIRHHLVRASQRHGFGWKRWSKAWLYGTLGLFAGYRVAR